MPPLDRIERQRLRRLQDHLLNRCIQAGATYEQISTVGVIYHPQLTNPALNIVIPHQGVAWTRSDDIAYAFEKLIEFQRKPTFQFLETLFPEAYLHQLLLKNLVQKSKQNVWLFTPVLGPSLPEENLYGQPEYDADFPYIQVVAVQSDDELKTWREVLGIHDDELVIPMKLYRWLAFYKRTPIAAISLVIDDDVASIGDMAIKTDWQGFGAESALLSKAIQQALLDNCRMVYTIETQPIETKVYQRIGLVPFTSILLYGYDKAKLNDSRQPSADVAKIIHPDSAN